MHEISSVGEISSVIPASWPGTMMLCAGALRLEDAVESFMVVDDGQMLAVSQEEREAVLMKDQQRLQGVEEYEFAA